MSARTSSPSRHGFAVVTGGAKRVGAVFAKALAADGWFVRLHYNGSTVAAEATAAAIRADGGRCDLVQADLANPDVAERILAPAGEAGFASLLVNSASIFDYDTAASVTAAHLAHNYAINATAPILLSKAFAVQLPEAKRGLIVNLLDQKLVNLNPDFFSYTLSKVALGAATTMLAQALAPRIRVNGIAPGITLPSSDQTDEEFAKAQAKTPLGYGSTPDDLVQALRYLIAAEAVTGQTVIVDGGQSLNPSPRDVMYIVRGE
ncbi:Diacetyl reductase [(S)-acetoin forming] [Alphaproteobacteria bacterium SO-S41]|nr:Diacetyl reductase [(S)-acetoin forming] [Alphaproteobacteria bacterium SO-S41]